MHQQTQQTDCDIADGIDKVEVSHYVSPRFGKSAVISHHTHSQNDSVQNLTGNAGHDSDEYD